MKLSSRFYGPYQITERIGAVTYKLKLLQDAKIHPVFHVPCLKPKLGERESPQIQLANTIDDGDIQAQPQAILDRRIVMRRRRPSTEGEWVGVEVSNELLLLASDEVPLEVSSV
ncbi:hypothetical protein MUK42_17528 [Musa troglodytarum]|uniref:Tf2-1-like SH3-like domain-containing protein n=1 Tax=Musa troglodytarum TaxID=320322 RepID=A0A9E7GYJ2_9LILI|nr:hypothetical protein MUK42_17528 [Musa troglodytarum]